MQIRIIKILIIGIFLSLIFWHGTGCDSILPDDFKQKEFTSSDLDVRAMDLLSRGVVRDIRGQLVLDSTTSVAVSKNLASLVDSATRANNTDNQIITSRFSVLVDSLRPGIGREKVALVTYPRGQEIVYALLEKTANQTKDFFLYLSLEFYTENENEYVTAQIIKSDASEIISSEDIQMEDAVSYIKKITFRTGSNVIERIVRVITARYKCTLEDGTYLVRFTLSNPAALTDPTIPVTGPAVFKVLILSR